eukprot:UN25414
MRGRASYTQKIPKWSCAGCDKKDLTVPVGGFKEDKKTGAFSLFCKDCYEIFQNGDIPEIPRPKRVAKKSLKDSAPLYQDDDDETQEISESFKNGMTPKRFVTYQRTLEHHKNYKKSQNRFSTIKVVKRLSSRTRLKNAVRKLSEKRILGAEIFGQSCDSPTLRRGRNLELIEKEIPSSQLTTLLSCSQDSTFHHLSSFENNDSSFSLGNFSTRSTNSSFCSSPGVFTCDTDLQTPTGIEGNDDLVNWIWEGHRSVLSVLPAVEKNHHIYKRIVRQRQP